MASQLNRKVVQRLCIESLQQKNSVKAQDYLSAAIAVKSLPKCLTEYTDPRYRTTSNTVGSSNRGKSADSVPKTSSFIAWKKSFKEAQRAKRKKSSEEWKKRQLESRRGFRDNSPADGSLTDVTPLTSRGQDEDDGGAVGEEPLNEEEAALYHGGDYLHEKYLPLLPKEIFGSRVCRIIAEEVCSPTLSLANQGLSSEPAKKTTTHWTLSDHLVASTTQSALQPKSNTDTVNSDKSAAPGGEPLQPEQQQEHLFSLFAPPVIPFDETEFHMLALKDHAESFDKEKNFIILPVGPHRRVAPFTSRLNFLITHKECATTDQLKLMVGRLLRGAVSSGYLKPRVVNTKSLRLYGEARMPLAIAQQYPNTFTDEAGNEIPGIPLDENHPMMMPRPIVISYCLYDHFYSRLLKATGPEKFVKKFTAHCKENTNGRYLYRPASGILFDLAKSEPVRATSEKELFETVGHEFVHPVERY